MSSSRFDIDVADDVRSVRRSLVIGESSDWFQRIWGIGVIAHLVGNPAVGQVVGDLTWRGAASLLTGFVAIAAVLRPDDRRLLAGLAVGVPVTVWLEAPILSNHWMLAGMVSLALGTAFLLGYSWAWFSASARLMHLTFYAFAAFAKLNSDFFDAAASCAVVFTNQTLESAGLPIIAPGTGLAQLLPFAVAAVELTIPILLVMKRTRFAGVLLGLVFHSLLSFDLGQHIYDFSGVLFPLFLLWLPSSKLGSLGEYLPERTQIVAGITLSLFVVATVLPATTVTFILLTRAVFLVWIPYALGLTFFVARMTRESADVSLKPPNATAWLLVGLVVLNGLGPYFEFKSANAWNMYSNLAVVDGESNHWIIRRGFPISDALADPIEVVATDDPGLQLYIGSGWLIPERNFADYLADHPETDVEFVQNGVTRRGVGADFAAERPILLEKFALLRSVDINDPVRCERVWYPAR